MLTLARSLERGKGMNKLSKFQKILRIVDFVLSTVLPSLFWGGAFIGLCLVMVWTVLVMIYTSFENDLVLSTKLSIGIISFVIICIYWHKRNLRWFDKY